MTQPTVPSPADLRGAGVPAPGVAGTAAAVAAASWSAAADLPAAAGWLGGKVATLAPEENVTMLRRRRVYGPGGLANRHDVSGERMVAARDLDDGFWWIAANAVWFDGDADRRQPHPTGLAVASSWTAAMLVGLSSRLGAEALVAGGDRLPELGRGARAELADDPALADILARSDLELLDGRVGDVPTVVIAGGGVLRAGAGFSWVAALQRALFGDAAAFNTASTNAVELRAIGRLLAANDIGVVGVDLGTAALGEAGITRCSVQLVNS